VPDEKDINRVRRRLDEDFDVIVTTNYYYHKAAAAITDFVLELQATGKPVVVVANTPYDFAAPGDLPTVLVCFNPGGREQLKAVAEILFGILKPTAKLKIKKKLKKELCRLSGRKN
jgi:beta-N-acetylhexosaminidase